VVTAVSVIKTAEAWQGKEDIHHLHGTQSRKEPGGCALVENPYAAIFTDVARVKTSDSRVAGKTSVYIFPDLDAGNTACKAVQRPVNVPAAPYVKNLTLSGLCFCLPGSDIY
jgi:hypothetical protein